MRSVGFSTPCRLALRRASTSGVSRSLFSMPRKRGLVVVLTALVLALVAVAPAQAGRRWCESDPVFLIAGRQVNVVVAIQEEHVPAVTGPIAVTLSVPPDV